ncbi:hypothetical protein IEU95_02505 [Hoyosella rhizosphaerae]|uniref:Uncharacterized protein n=1 Tax=Hoyosella rhizosphaerae TaxID=1755582 RepID=A0A916UD72_9ACTN|nr:hypothetical protein [Hoyosella rhizosphaerae]MBN4925687.1 hypothetical protein [Hoyosella rhizosphaerae]GGC68703.1 hypothetical protein GCM10011410_21850 [Hoyosella rhizosphaerae]
MQLERQITPGLDTEVPANARELENIPTERQRAPGQQPRSEREEIPGGFTNAEAECAERLELESAAIEDASRAPSDIQGTGAGAGCDVY